MIGQSDFFLLRRILNYAGDSHSVSPLELKFISAVNSLNVIPLYAYITQRISTDTQLAMFELLDFTRDAITVNHQDDVGLVPRPRVGAQKQYQGSCQEAERYVFTSVSFHGGLKPYAK